MSHRILVVDNDHDNADSLAMLLSALGHHVKTAYNACAAFAAASAHKPHVIFLDLAMPKTTGFSLAREMRVSGVDALLVAHTGLTDNSHREDAKDAGIDAYLTKPASLKQLQEVLSLVPVTA